MDYSNYNQKPPHDMVPLPSEGKFYKHKKASLPVSYLTASDENILTSLNLVESGRVLEVLLENKILDKEIKVADLLPGDANAILFFLRSSGYGPKYTVTLNDPKTGKDFEHTFDLSEIKSKQNEVASDEDGYIPFYLERAKKTVKFRYLTQAEDDAIKKADEDRRKKLGKNAISELLTKRLIAQVVAVDNVVDKSEIEYFINNLIAGDAAKLRKFIEKNEPGLDLEFEVEAPSKETFRLQLPVTSSFLWPYYDDL